MSIIDNIVICVEILKIDDRFSLKNEFSQLIHMNPWIVLYLILNHEYSCHDCICSLLDMRH